jgi:predicted lactoylglutathione lyase
MFYSKIGLKIVEDYSNEQGFCIELSKYSYVMILEKSHFQFFHPDLSLSTLDTHSSFLSLEMSSKEHVDRFMKKVIKHGGIETDTAVDNDDVYYRSFKDLDFHQFEVFIMKNHA